VESPDVLNARLQQRGARVAPHVLNAAASSGADSVMLRGMPVDQEPPSPSVNREPPVRPWYDKLPSTSRHSRQWHLLDSGEPWSALWPARYPPSGKAFKRAHGVPRCPTESLGVVSLGKPKLHVARSNAVSAVIAEADKFAANVQPIIREAQKAGATTIRQIADALNARGIPTARGGQWYAQTVANVLERA
jgi:hypothetical protein